MSGTHFSLKRIGFGFLLLVAVLGLLSTVTLPAQAQSETVLYNFTGGSDGFHPEASLISDDAGNFYGTTLLGGVGCPGNSLGCGVVFEISPNGSGGWKQTVLHSFSGPPDAANPFLSPVIFDKAGNLYGATEFGGTYNWGAVFELSPGATGWTATILYSFTGGADGGHPAAGLIMDGAGNLYGMSSEYLLPGNVFELSPSAGGWTEQVIYATPAWGGLTMDAAGNIYGTTGANEVFELTPNGSGGWNPAVIHTFACAPNDGCDAQGAPVLDQAGNLYGVTSEGGATNNGTVYKLSPGANGEWTEQILYSFEGGKDGANPAAGIVFDAAGNIYGTSLGGSKKKGTVFELLALGGSQYQHVVLWTFNGTDGVNPYSVPLLDSAGNLYGTASSGGSNNAGVVFEVTVPAATATTLSSSPNPSTYEQAVTFAATVSSSLGAPPNGDTVLFKKGATVLGTGSLSGGSASFTTSALPVGTSSITAVYSGDLHFLGSKSSPVKQLVKEAATATTLSSSPNPSTYGQAVTFTATVSSSLGAPPDGDTVTFKEGATVLGTASLSGGSASFTTSALPVGKNRITAIYSGDPDFLHSRSSVVKQVVD
jgi:uncharacterized repeat protein (TIGR03803 family)